MLVLSLMRMIGMWNIKDLKLARVARCDFAFSIQLCLTNCRFVVGLSQLTFMVQASQEPHDLHRLPVPAGKVDPLQVPHHAGPGSSHPHVQLRHLPGIINSYTQSSFETCGLCMATNYGCLPHAILKIVSIDLHDINNVCRNLATHLVRTA